MFHPGAVPWFFAVASEYGLWRPRAGRRVPPRRRSGLASGFGPEADPESNTSSGEITDPGRRTSPATCPGPAGPDRSPGGDLRGRDQTTRVGSLLSSVAYEEYGRDDTRRGFRRPRRDRGVFHRRRRRWTARRGRSRRCRRPIRHRRSGSGTRNRRHPDRQAAIADSVYTVARGPATRV